MPQMNKGGKFIFGESMIRPDGLVHLPPQAIEEYQIASEKTCICLPEARLRAASV